ncbi:MAG: hypothetical protein IJ449_04900 [Clostridia bacterium]|nr:hypothetical protein [Clostridia bacterium]
MKRQFFLCFLLTALLCASCADETDSGAVTTDTVSTSTVTETVVDDDRLPAPEILDMNGAVLTILNSTAESFNWATTTILVDEPIGEILNDALFDREQRVEELYNCSIEEIPEENANMRTAIPNAVSAGDKYFDTAMVFDASVATILLKDCLLSWDEVRGLDLSQPWWDNAATETYNFGGIQAAVSGAYSLYNYSTRHVYVFNNKMMAELDVEDDLYTLVRDEKWTLETMYALAELAVSDLNGDGKMEPENDRYGIIGTPTRHYSALLMGAGVKYVDKDSDGKLYFAVPGNEHAQTVMSKFVQLDSQNPDIFNDKLADINVDIDTVFTDGRAMFCAAYVGEAAKMRSLEFDIGFVPPPKFDEEQTEYYSLVEGGAQSVLPRTLDEADLEKVGILLNALGYYSYYESIPAYINVLLKEKVARDIDSAEMLELVFDCSAYDLGTGVWSAETKNKYVSSIFSKSSPEIVSQTEKITAGVEAQLEKFEAALADLS